jgi:hypothetical protein
VAGVADDDQLAVRPGAVHRPGGVQRAADVEPAVHHHARDADEPARLAEQLTVGQEAAQ